MHPFIRQLRDRASITNPRIAFPESTEPRILEAVEHLAKKHLCQPVLIGNPNEIQSAAIKSGVHLLDIEIIDPSEDDQFDEYAKQLTKQRRKKGMTQKKARVLLRDNNYYACMLVQNNVVDGVVAGAAQSTAKTLRPALQLLKQKNHLASSFTLLVLPNKVWAFADCALNIEPNVKGLATIALDTYGSAERFGIDPRLALLSFSTKGSANHPSQAVVAKASLALKEAHPQLFIDGELQFDAAVNPEVAQIKNPNGKIKGDANVFVFPNISAANIAYKLLQREAQALAIGPLVQGLNYPVNDLSRGADIQEIINTVAATAVQIKNPRS